MKISRLITAIAIAVLALLPNVAQATAPIPASLTAYQTNTPLIASPMILQAVTTATRTSAIDISRYNVCGAQYIIDQGTTPNTVTLAFQASNDGATWEALGASALSAANVITSNTSDTNGFYTFYTPVARFVSISATTGNTQTVTTTLRMVCK